MPTRNSGLLILSARRAAGEPEQSIHPISTHSLDHRGSEHFRVPGMGHRESARRVQRSLGFCGAIIGCRWSDSAVADRSGLLTVAKFKFRVLPTSWATRSAIGLDDIGEGRGVYRRCEA